jgi:hypothetical protein
VQYVCHSATSLIERIAALGLPAYPLHAYQYIYLARGEFLLLFASVPPREKGWGTKKERVRKRQCQAGQAGRQAGEEHERGKESVSKYYTLRGDLNLPSFIG